VTPGTIRQKGSGRLVCVNDVLRLRALIDLWECEFTPEKGTSTK
jgi:hypothetical protein